MNINVIGKFDLYSIIFILIIIILIALIIMNLTKNKKIKVLEERYTRFMKGSSGKDLNDVLEKCFSNIEYLKNERSHLKNEIEEIKIKASESLQNVGLIRFNAFHDIGSDMSFAIALLDDKCNGIVISSLFSRETSTTYGKPIIGGKSKYTLSDEEIEAIMMAKKRSITKLQEEN